MNSHTMRMRRERRWVGLAVIAVALGLSSCAQDAEQGAPTAEESNASLRALAETLSIGSSGDAVTAVHRYLERHGYFPNAELAQQYPRWSPEVEWLPERDDVFDEQTELAVRAFQRNAGLEINGTVDEATRDRMLTPRCGVPDGVFEPHHPREVDPEAGLVPKIAFIRSGPWNKKSLTWRLTNSSACAPGTSTCPTTAQAKEAIASAFAIWASTTGLTFTQLSSGTPDIMFTFKDLSHLAGGTVLGRADAPAQGGDVELNSAWPWTLTALKANATHEIGHALGLDHTSLNETIMSVFTSVVVPTPEDHVAISALYDDWTQLPGTAKDIAVGANGAVWTLSTTSAFGGYGIQQLVNNSWVAAPGVAKRIAVGPTGVPWVIAPNGSIFKLSTTSASTGTWQQVTTGCATDIAIGADGSVWSLGCTSIFGGFGIQKLSGNSWVPASGVGVRIAVNQLGMPTVMLPNGSLARLTSSNPTTGTWDTAFPNIGTNATPGVDIANDHNGYTFVTGALLSVPQVLVQNAVIGSTAGFNEFWPLTFTSAVALAAGPLPGGNPGVWYVRSIDNAILRQSK